MGVVALNHTDYLVGALGELRKHAAKTLKQVRRYRRKALSSGNAEWFSSQAMILENEARQDLELIQKILANPGLNR